MRDALDDSYQIVSRNGHGRSTKHTTPTKITKRTLVFFVGVVCFVALVPRPWARDRGSNRFLQSLSYRPVA